MQKVKEAQADVSQLQQSNLQQLQQLHQEAAAYLGELDGVHAVLQELVGKCMLEVQPKMVQVMPRWQSIVQVQPLQRSAPHAPPCHQTDPVWESSQQR